MKHKSETHEVYKTVKEFNEQRDPELPVWSSTKKIIRHRIFVAENAKFRSKEKLEKQ